MQEPWERSPEEAEARGSSVKKSLFWVKLAALYLYNIIALPLLNLLAVLGIGPSLPAMTGLFILSYLRRCLVPLFEIILDL
jgi:hypothetical protein